MACRGVPEFCKGMRRVSLWAMLCARLASRAQGHVQAVSVNGFVSQPKVGSGIPRGCVLGPILCNQFINDFEGEVTAMFMLYECKHWLRQHKI